MESLQFMPGKPAKILLVDDEPGTLQLMRTVLQPEGHLVYDARDGAEAIAEFFRIRPDLVLLDVMLPKVDGLDVLRAIREQDVITGVIMISALSSEQLAVRSMLGGADDFLSKPLTLRTIRVRIRQVLDKVSLRRHNAMLQEQLIAANERLRRYMAAPLLETLLASPSLPSLGGERQAVTILFLDFCDFTATTLNVPPDEVVRMLNQYFALLTTSVLENGGYLDKIMGDGFMALFNVPMRQANHATMAVRCALEMRSRVNAFNRDHRFGRPWMNIRTGIHTGEALVGNIGSPKLMNFTAIGREVNLAKRLEEEAEACQILVSAATCDLLDLEDLGGRSTQIVSLGPRYLHGFDAPQEVFHIVDATLLTRADPLSLEAVGVTT
jgi:adenylate cyclase